MQLIRPKIIGTLKIQVMKAGNYAVVNNIKSTPNKIIIACRSKEHGEEMIMKLQSGKPGELLNL